MRRFFSHLDVARMYATSWIGEAYGPEFGPTYKKFLSVSGVIP